MQKAKADEIVQIFNEAGVECVRASRPGQRRSWAICFTLDSMKRDEFEDILIKHSDLKMKSEYEPLGISQERIYIF